MATGARPPRVLIGQDELSARVDRLAAEVSGAYPDGVLLVEVLKGSTWFLADLARALTVRCEVDFLAISAYGAGRAGARLVKDLEADISGRDVVVVDVMVDTGLTLTYLTGELARRRPRSVESCILLDKTARRLVPTAPRFVGFAIPDEVVVGYGVDFAERYRNLGAVVAGDLPALRADPDAYVRQLFSG